jgi:hypothetical protein
MTGAVFASTYLDPPSGLLYVPRTAVKDNASGWPRYARFHRGAAADALRRARRNSAMGMTDANAVAAIPAYLIKHLTQASQVKDQSGAFIAPNILTDFQAMTAPGVVPT